MRVRNCFYMLFLVICLVSCVYILVKPSLISHYIIKMTYLAMMKYLKWRRGLYCFGFAVVIIIES